MTSSVNVPPEKLCYIPCNFCNIVLAVNVPCSNMFDNVTVLCGHCKNLWSVKMASAFQSRSWQDPQAQIYSYNTPDHYRIDAGSSSKCNNKMTLHPRTKNSDSAERLANQTPKKRQRVPSAYNQFIKEEIQRIKVNKPNISHREAFSTAAKNWAHFPHIHYSLWSDARNKQPGQG